jgi:cellobiose-specific phosphotransferase system component IIA
MNKKTISSTTVAIILATGLAASNVSPAFAKSHNEHMSTATQKNKDAKEEMVKVSEDAMLSLRDT